MQELIYAIDKDCSINDKAIAIKIQLANKIGFAYKPLEKQEILTQGKLLKASSAKDSQLIPFLIKEELSYLKTRFKKNSLDPNTLFNTVRIAYSETMEAFKLFSTTGKLFFHDKALIVDIYGKTEFFYKVTPNTIEGWIKTKSERYILEDSIEQKMMKLKSMKSGLAKELLDGDDISISALTIDDLMFLRYHHARFDCLYCQST